MEVNWYKKYALDKYYELRKLRNSKNAHEVDMTIDQIIILLCSDNDSPLTKDNLVETIWKEYEAIKNYKILWHDINTLNKNCTQVIPCNPDILSMNLSNEDIFTLVHDFFKNGTPKQIYNQFMHFFKDYYDHVNIIRDAQPNFYGDQFYLPYYKESFIQLCPKNELADAAVLAHEYGHCIQNINNFNPAMFGKNYAFLEIVSSFFEFLFFIHYSKHGSMKEVALHALIDTMEERKDQCSNLSRFIYLTHYMELNNNCNEKDAKARIQKYLSMYGQGNLAEFFEEGILSDDFLYVFAYLICAELLNIYYIDPDKAFYYLKKIIDIDLNLDPQDYYNAIVNLGIIPNANYLNFENQIKRELKFF